MKKYSFLDVSMYVNGVEINGWAEGESVIVANRLEDSASHIISARGEMIITLSAARAGEIKMTLSQTSDSNSYLQGLIDLQENSVFEEVNVMFKDNFGNSLGRGSVGYLLRPADVAHGSNASNREWTIRVERLDLIDNN